MDLEQWKTPAAPLSRRKPVPRPTPAAQAAGMAQLMAAHAGSLRDALVRRFGAPPPDPDDAIQSAILKFLELDGRETIGNVAAFLFALARNLMIDELRRLHVRARHRHSVLQSAEGLGLDVDRATPETHLLARERAQLLETALQSLSPAARQILVLSRIEGLPYSEISARTGHSPAFISRSIQRSLKQLSACLLDRERGGQG